MKSHNQEIIAIRLKDAAELLRLAAEFEDHEWTWGANAINRHRRTVDPGSPNAVQFCAQGLLLRAIRRNPALYNGHLFPAVNAGLPETCKTIPGWNDRPERKPEEIRQLFLKTADQLDSQVAERSREAQAEAPLAVAV